MTPSRATRTARRSSLSMQQPLPASTILDRIFFLIATVSAIWLAVVVGVEGVKSPWSWWLFIPVWAILAYLALPRLHRMLSDLYVPDYFFGRTRTADGLLGDPVNMAVNGSFAQLDTVMNQAGWYRADEITARSTWLIILSTITGRSYPTAPVSTLMLFGRRHDVAYQQEVDGNAKQRHHVRFWHTPQEWLLPGGTRVDWLGAGTYDTAVGISWFTLQITHRIDENTDIERDYVVGSMTDAEPAVSVESLPNFTTGYHSRNGGGDRFITDGALPIIDVSRVAVAADERNAVADQLSAREALRRAPLSAIAGVVFVLVISVIDFLIPAINALTVALDGVAETDVPLIRSISIVLLGIILLIELLLVGAFLRRSRIARVLLMTLLTLSIIEGATSYFYGTTELRIDWLLLSTTMQCIALISFATESTARWVRSRGDEKATGADAVEV